MELLIGLLGALLGFALGIYVMYLKGKQLTTQYLDKLLVNSLLKDSLKDVETKKSKKTKK
jgi:hypothetical protein